MLGFGYFRRWIHDVRAAATVAHVRPAYAAGFRAAIATITPLVLSPWIPGGGASWISLAGFNGALLDRVGPYRTRSRMMVALAFASAIAAAAGSLASGHVVVSAILTFVLAFVCGLARAWTDLGPGFGVTILVMYAVALAVPAPSVEAALVRSGFVIVGGGWAMILAVLLWPLRPYRPLRLHVGECYRAIARYIEAAIEFLEQDGSVDTWKLKSHIVAVRTAIDAARASLAVTRRPRPGETVRGARLLVLHEVADQLFAHVNAFLDESDALLRSPPVPPDAARRIDAALADIARALRGVAIAVQSEIDLPRTPVFVSGAPLVPLGGALADVADRIAEYLTSAAAIAATLNSGDPVEHASETIDVADPPPEPVLFSLDAILHPPRPIVHHALRVAFAATAAVLISATLHLKHASWVILTVIVILQPFSATTRQKALQRIGGTIIGGMLAATLSAQLDHPITTFALIGGFTALCVALLPLNYGAYAVFGTPAFVLLAEAGARDPNLAALRIVNTLVGGALALIAAKFLWPGDERERMPELAAAALRANDEFLQRALALVAQPGRVDVGSLRDARRGVGNAALSAEDSFQRLLSDHRGAPELLEPVMAFLVYTRRIAGSTTALAVAANTSEKPSAEELRPFADAAHAMLVDLADAVLEGRSPLPAPAIGTVPLPSTESGPVIRQRLSRLARQLKLLHDAVARWTTSTETQLSTD